MVFELHHLTAQEQWDWLQRGEITPVELAEHYLERIERLDPALGAFVTVTADAAIDRARALADSVPRTAPLWGLPFGDKDLVNRAGVPTGFGSRLMDGFVPDASDELVDVLDAAGGVSLGKTNAPEFGLPSYTESLVAPPARNPWDVSLEPPRWPPDWCPSPRVRMAEARCASRLRRAGSSASSRRAA
jgi:amidase